MILQCPECRARFLVPDQALGAIGRAVRCGRCKHQWFAPSPAPDPLAPQESPDINAVLEKRQTPQVEPAPEDIKLRALPPGSNLPAKKKGAFPLRAVCAAIFLLACLAGMTVLSFMPSTLGLASAEGMALENVQLKKVEVPTGSRFGKDTERYTLEGVIRSGLEAPARVPTLRVQLTDAEGKVLREWYYSQKGYVAPGGNVRFSAENMDKPAGEGTRFKLDIGNPLELALRKDP